LKQKNKSVRDLFQAYGLAALFFLQKYLNIFVHSLTSLFFFFLCSSVGGGGVVSASPKKFFLENSVGGRLQRALQGVSAKHWPRNGDEHGHDGVQRPSERNDDCHHEGMVALYMRILLLSLLAPLLIVCRWAKAFRSHLHELLFQPSHSQTLPIRCILTLSSNSC